MVGAARPTEQSRVASALLRVAGGALLLGGVVTGYAAAAIFRQEGILPEGQRVGGRCLDLVVEAMVARDWAVGR